jgi:hypothetical protein
MNPVLKTSIVLAAILSQSFAFADRKWNDANDPRNLDGSYSLNFYQLPPKGDVSDTNKGWSSSYWPKTRGYIAERWQDPTQAGSLKYKDYHLPSQYEIQSMSAAQLNLLSPAEKFDIARGRFDLPIATALIKEDANPKQDWWRGLCNGWTLSSVNLPEPHSAEVKIAKLNQPITFNSGDMKALLAYYYSYDRSPSKYIGKSCRAGKKLLFDIDGSCKDVNAAAFHVALLNEIGMKHNPLAIDRDPSVQVWNQPFVKYEMTVDRVEERDISKKATDGTRREVYVTTVAYYANEQYKIDPSEIAQGKTREWYEDDTHSHATAYPVMGTPEQEYGHKTYKYVLELDSRDQIIGGDWLNDSDFHPDLVWKQTFNLPSTGYDKDGKGSDWSMLKNLIQQATQYAK